MPVIYRCDCCGDEYKPDFVGRGGFQLYSNNRNIGALDVDGFVCFNCIIRSLKQAIVTLRDWRDNG